VADLLYIEPWVRKVKGYRYLYQLIMHRHKMKEKAMEKKSLMVGIIGCGAIGGYVLDSVTAGKVDHAEVSVVCGRSEKSKGREKVKALGIPWVTDPREMLRMDLASVGVWWCIERLWWERTSCHWSTVWRYC